MNQRDQHRLDAARLTGDVYSLVRLADGLFLGGDLHAAAAALDCAYGLDPLHSDVVQYRAALLDQLSVDENGIKFRYVPSG